MDIADRFPQPYKGFYFRKSDGAFILNSDDLGKAVEIMNHDKLKKLEINPNYFNQSDLSFLSKFSFIEELSILISSFTGISQITNLKNLKKIFIQHKYKEEINFSTFHQLEELSVVWGLGCDSIFRCENLKELAIHKYPKYELMEFYRLDKLNSLRLVDGKMISLKGIENLTHLKKLELFYCYELENLNEIEKLNMLERFDIESCPLIKNLEKLSEAVSLKSLNFRIKGSIETIKYFKTLINLEEISFSDTNISDGDLNVLAYLMKKGKLNVARFKKRKHYTHTPEELGYEIPTDIAKIFKK